MSAALALSVLAVGCAGGDGEPEQAAVDEAEGGTSDTDTPADPEGADENGPATEDDGAGGSGDDPASLEGTGQAGTMVVDGSDAFWDVHHSGENLDGTYGVDRAFWCEDEDFGSGPVPFTLVVHGLVDTGEPFRAFARIRDDGDELIHDLSIAQHGPFPLILGDAGAVRTRVTEGADGWPWIEHAGNQVTVDAHMDFPDEATLDVHIDVEVPPEPGELGVPERAAYC